MDAKLCEKMRQSLNLVFLYSASRLDSTTCLNLGFRKIGRTKQIMGNPLSSRGEDLHHPPEPSELTLGTQRFERVLRGSSWGQQVATYTAR